MFGIDDVEVGIKDMRLYINGIFVDPVIYDVIIKDLRSIKMTTYETIQMNTDHILIPFRRPIKRIYMWKQSDEWNTHEPPPKDIRLIHEGIDMNVDSKFETACFPYLYGTPENTWTYIFNIPTIFTRGLSISVDCEKSEKFIIVVEIENTMLLTNGSCLLKYHDDLKTS